MNKNLLPITVFLVFNLSAQLGSAAEAVEVDGSERIVPKHKTYQVGEKSINLTTPMSEMVVMSEPSLAFLQGIVTNKSRVITGFALENELAQMESGDEDRLSKYAVVVVLKSAENGSYDEKDFAKATEGAVKAFGKLNSVENVEAEWNRKMKAMNLADAVVDIRKPIKLGNMFTRSNTYGYGMIIPMEMDGESTTVAMGAAMVLVKDKILFLYLYVDYENEETATWLRGTTQQWVDAVLEANEQS